MNEQQVKALLVMINAGMRILSIRIVLGLTLLLAFTLFAWAMYYPTNERIIVATVFAVLVFLPVIRADSKDVESKKVSDEGA